MTIPYEPKPIGGLYVPAGQSAFFSVDLPSRATIYKILCQQVGGGAGVAFTLEFFNSENAAQGRSESDSEGPGAGGLPPEMYRVTPVLRGVGGRFEYFNENGAGFPFFSHDFSRLGNHRKVWLKITNEGAANQTFALSVGAHNPE